DRMSGVEETPPAAGEEREPDPAPEAAGSEPAESALPVEPAESAASVEPARPVDLSYPRVLASTPPSPSSFPHRPARSMAAAMLAAGLVIGIGGGALAVTLASKNRPLAALGQASPSPSSPATQLSGSPPSSDAAGGLSPTATYKQSPPAAASIARVAR